MIIGGGHNGLVTAVTLANANKKVLLLEQRPVLGGAAAGGRYAGGATAGRSSVGSSVGSSTGSGGGAGGHGGTEMGLAPCGGAHGLDDGARGFLFEQVAHGSGLEHAVDVAMTGGAYVLVADASDGLHIVDVSRPDQDPAFQVGMVGLGGGAILDLRTIYLGGTLSNVVKTTVFLADMGDFAAMNEVYARHFGDHRPARAAVAVRTLPKNVSVEIEAVARLA